MTKKAAAPANLRARREGPAIPSLNSPKWRDQEAVITPQTKITYLPSAPVFARHQSPPGAPIVGAGFVAAGVGIDIKTMKAWA